MIDLKKSESYRERQLGISAQSIVSQWRAAMAQVLVESEVVFLQSKGDELCFFILEAQAISRAQIALLLTQKLAFATDTLNQHLVALGRLKSPMPELSFRASVVRGAIKPVIDLVDNKEYPEWEDAPDSAPFLTASRQLAAEGKLDLPRSTLIFNSDMTEELFSESNQREKVQKIKGPQTVKPHGQSYQLSYFDLTNIVPKALSKVA